MKEACEWRGVQSGAICNFTPKSYSLVGVLKEMQQETFEISRVPTLNNLSLSPSDNAGHCTKEKAYMCTVGSVCSDGLMVKKKYVDAFCDIMV